LLFGNLSKCPVSFLNEATATGCVGDNAMFQKQVVHRGTIPAILRVGIRRKPIQMGQSRGPHLGFAGFQLHRCHVIAVEDAGQGHDLPMRKRLWRLAMALPD
jgi:hypothetical protein